MAKKQQTKKIKKKDNGKEIFIVMTIWFESNTQHFLSKIHYPLFIPTRSFLGTLN